MEVMTGRAWPYHAVDHNAKKTREYVLQEFWQDYVSNKCGRRDEILTNALAVPKSVFSHAMTETRWMDGMKKNG